MSILHFWRNKMKVFDKRIDEIQNDEDAYFVYLSHGHKIDEGSNHDNLHCFGSNSKIEIKKCSKGLHHVSAIRAKKEL